MEKVAYGGWPNCIKLSNGEIELIATTDVGPRIIRFGFAGGQNLFKEFSEQMGKTGDASWNIYGGHRLWHAPERRTRTYALDNEKIDYRWENDTLTLTQPTEKTTGIQKTIEITMDADSNRVTVLHRLVNENLWDVTLAPWALTVMARHGRVIFPQEPFRAHTDYLLPARPLVLWHYTNMGDPRWTWSEKYIQLRQDPNANDPEKLGMFNAQGWAAYTKQGDVFIKRYAAHAGAAHVDMGCNTETFTNGDFIEVETVGPLTELAAEGGSVEHTEDWFLFKGDVGTDDAAIDATLLPLVKQTDRALALGIR